MNITETTNDGLKRSFAVVVAAKDLADKLDMEVAKAAPQVRMPGFRPGKVPKNLIKKMHGPAMTQQVLESSVQDATQKILAENGLRPALQPKIEITKYAENADLEFSMDVEVLPEIPAVSLDGLDIEKLVVPVTDTEVDAAVAKLAASQKAWEDADTLYTAHIGDAVVMDYLGKIDGKPFDGGKGEAMQIELGSNGLIPGFEDQMVGLKAGDEKLIEVSFPEDYQAAELKGKAATFDVVIKQVKTSKPIEINDEMAQGFGLEGLDKLRDLMKNQVEREHDGLSRTYMKRKLLDALAAQHDFPVPGGMVEAEFEQIWAQLKQEVGEDAAENAKLEDEKDDYRNIAVRRVRLGLLLSEIGQKNNVQITNQEMSRLISQEAMRYPSQQKEVVKFFSENAMAAAQLRAPLYEEKVVDYIFGQIKITERNVTRAEIEAAIQDEGDAAKVEEKPKKITKQKTIKPSEEIVLDTDVTDKPTEIVPKPKKKAPSKKD